MQPAQELTPRAMPRRMPQGALLTNSAQLMKNSAFNIVRSVAVVGMTLGLTLAARPAAAQYFSPVSTSASPVEGPGVKVGEGTVFHPTVGAETGFISNLFYTNDNAEPAGVGRLLIEGAIGSLSQQRLARSSAEAAEIEEEQRKAAESRGDLEYRAQAALQYNEFFSGTDAVRAQRAIGGALRLTGNVFPMRTWQFSFDENFRRMIRPTNYESQNNVNRDINQLRLWLKYQPKGRSISGHLRYENTIDMFESSAHGFADRFLNNFGLRVNWQWLPVTRFYSDVQFGLFSGFGADSQKASSMPLRAVAGVQTAITENSTVAAHAGYGQGFYSAGPDVGGLLAGAQFGYRYSPLGRFTLGYQYDFQDSINANFYRDHVVKAQVQQQLVPIALAASAEFRLREYQGVLTNVQSTAGAVRNDVIFAVDANAHYNFRDYLAATLAYNFTTVQTDFMYRADDGLVLNPSYVRHQLLAGVRYAF